MRPGIGTNGSKPYGYQPHTAFGHEIEVDVGRRMSSYGSERVAVVKE